MAALSLELMLTVLPLYCFVAGKELPIQLSDLFLELSLLTLTSNLNQSLNRSLSQRFLSTLDWQTSGQVARTKRGSREQFVESFVWAEVGCYLARLVCVRFDLKLATR